MTIPNIIGAPPVEADVVLGCDAGPATHTWTLTSARPSFSFEITIALERLREKSTLLQINDGEQKTVVVTRAPMPRPPDR